MRYTFLVILVPLALAGLPVTAATPTLDEIWQVVQRQQQEIESLQAALQSNVGELRDTKEQLLATQNRLAQSQKALEIQNERLDSTAAMLETGVASVTDKGVSIGGYGELHYNNLDNSDEIDFHRFVLFFGHQFTDNLSFYSEVELEHSIAADGEAGEVELEQAFVQWDYADSHRARAGLFLIPLGIMNETHEPDTFYGVERNRVENQVIPTTWWEAGLGFQGDVAPGWSYDLAIHSGLNLNIGSANPASRSSVRSARQKVSEANADSLAYTARLGYSGIPGLQWRAAVQYQTDMTQGNGRAAGFGEIDGRLFETDLTLQRGSLGLRALYARWDLDDTITLLNPGADEQFGWYIEPSLRLDNGVGLFMRYGRYDLTAGSSAASDEKSQLDIGINYWLHENVVIKADYQRQDNDNGNDIDGFNIGVGYSF